MGKFCHNCGEPIVTYNQLRKAQSIHDILNHEGDDCMDDYLVEDYVDPAIYSYNSVEGVGEVFDLDDPIIIEIPKTDKVKVQKFYKKAIDFLNKYDIPYEIITGIVYTIG